MTHLYWIDRAPSAEPVDSEAPERLGESMLTFARKIDPAIDVAVNEHGKPDAIYTDNDASTWLVYLEPAILLERRRGARAGEVHSRLLEKHEIDFLRVRHITDRAQRDSNWARVEMTIKYGHVLRVMRHLIQVVPEGSFPAFREGYWSGFLSVPASPSTALRFGHPSGIDGSVVVWVDGEGPANGQLRQGDLLLGRTPCPEVLLAEPENKEACSLVDVVRGGERIGARIESERWPLLPSLRLLFEPEENAHAVVVTVNAPSGEPRFVPYLMVTPALLELQDSEDSLAWILGHELAHLLEEHHIQRGVTLDDFLGFMSTLAQDPRSATAAAARQFTTSYSQRLELEADRLGARLAYRAGYDPLAAIPFLERREPYRAGYPTARLRIEQIRAAIEEEDARR